MADVDPIVAALRRHRQDADLSQTDLARRLFVDHQWVSARERGVVNTAIDDARRWAQALGCELVLLPPHVKTKGGPQ